MKRNRRSQRSGRARQLRRIIKASYTNEGYRRPAIKYCETLVEPHGGKRATTVSPITPPNPPSKPLAGTLRDLPSKEVTTITRVETLARPVVIARPVAVVKPSVQKPLEAPQQNVEARADPSTGRRPRRLLFYRPRPNSDNEPPEIITLQ